MSITARISNDGFAVSLRIASGMNATIYRTPVIDTGQPIGYNCAATERSGSWQLQEIL